jgi:hypothetical protein
MHYSQHPGLRLSNKVKVDTLAIAAVAADGMRGNISVMADVS